MTGREPAGAGDEISEPDRVDAAEVDADFYGVDDSIDDSRWALRPRPTPPGLSRKDRREWQALEAERLALTLDEERSVDDWSTQQQWRSRRAAAPRRLGFRGRRAFRREDRARRARWAGELAEHRDSQRTLDSWSGGFSRKPPPGLGRRGRRAFRAQDREFRERWWGRQRAKDADTRATGALVLVLLLAGLILWRVIASNSDPGPTEDRPDATRAAAAPADDAAGGQSVSASAVATTPPTATAAAATDGASSAAPSTSRSGSVSASAGVEEVGSATVFGNGSNTARATGGIVPPPGVTGVELPPDGGLRVQDPPPAGMVPAADQGSAVVLARAWYERTCPSDWEQEFGAAVTANRSVMSPAGWAYADPTRDTVGRRWWAGEVVAGREVRRCANVAARPWDGPQPADRNVMIVTITADRLVTSGTSDPVVEKLFERRYMERAGSVWSVGAPAVGG